MPAVVIERPNLPTEMRDALKKHILRERQRKKEEADANEADKQRRREEKVNNITPTNLLRHRSTA
jgi:G protein pathway suppressor 2